MTMQITAPQAQKRCCFIEISSCSETSSFRHVVRYYSRWDALCITESDGVMPVQTFFRYMVGDMPYCRRKAAENWLALLYPTDWAYPQHAKRGVPQQLRCTLHPPLLQPGVDRQSVQATETPP